MDDLKRALERATAAGRAASRDDDGVTLNVAGRRNVVVAGNVGGRDGAVEHASAKQTTRIRQVDGETVEETETTEVADSPG